MDGVDRLGAALPEEEREVLISTLATRFAGNMSRHEGLEWPGVLERLLARADRLWTLQAMERTGGEPDVVGYHGATGEYIFYDCSPESPSGRRQLCYDEQGLESRRANRPEGSAMGMARAMGIALLNEDQYRQLQRLGRFDTKTSSWLITPAPIRALGGALFASRRYDAVFVYANGAGAYFADRGFRGSLRV